MAKKLRPSHSVWECVSEWVKPAGKIYPGCSAQNANATIKALFSKIVIGYSHSYPSHGFRRGTPHGIKEKGQKWPVVSILGDWRSLAFLGYVDLAQDVDRDTPNLLAETDQSDSDGEKVHHWVNGPAGGMRSIDGR